VAKAHRIVDAFKASVASAKGALQLDGEMVDIANVKVAQSILARAGVQIEL
jgi:citrate lyase beta subunit